MFRADFGPAYKVFNNIQSTEIFRSRRRFFVLTAVTSVSEAKFSSANSGIVNAAAFFCSLLRSVLHAF